MLTLGPRTRSLLAAATGPLGEPSTGAALAGHVGEELSELLRQRNGFYAFESALHVYAAGDPGALGGSLEEWNASTGWRAVFGSMADGLVFFAEDIFGSQFALSGNQIAIFEPETGQVDVMATSIEDWADQLLADHEMFTGFPLARDWQSVHGQLSPGQRLVPKVPFVLGGAFEVDNVYALDASEGMGVRGELAVQIRDMPEGGDVQYRVIE